MMKLLSHSLRLGLVAVMLSLVSCDDGNLFGKLHKAGDSGDVASLTADANEALREGNYSLALSLYERILAQDPDNSDALYGASAAAIAGSGLDLGVLISNILNQGSSAPSISGIGDAIARARVGSGASSAAANSILANINLDALAVHLDVATCRLRRIVSGASDGRISRDDIDTLVNYGFLSLIRAAVTAIRNDYLDIVNNGGDYDVVELTGDDMASVCSGTAQQQANVVQIARDLANAYALFNRAASVLGLANDQIIVKLRNDIDEAAAEIFTGGSHQMAASCISLLNAATPPINETTFTTTAGQEAFTAPSSGC